jgi:hypothetical protein
VTGTAKIDIAGTTVSPLVGVVQSHPVVFRVIAIMTVLVVRLVGDHDLGLKLLFHGGGDGGSPSSY